MARRSVFDADFDFDPAEAIGTGIVGLLEERGERAQELRATRLSFREWAGLVPEERGPLDFDRFRFQRELYDQHAAEDHEQVYMKSTQVGVSTQSLRWALYHADVHQRVVLYTFPTDGELTDFSRQRIRPVIRRSEHLMRRMRGDAVDNVGQKQIGTGGWIYFRGTQKPVDSVPADVIVFDEYDTSDQANLEATERRVSGPQSAGLIRRVGVPSIPGFGIDELYERSDQRVWTVKCDACGEHNPIHGLEAFERNVDPERLELVCRRGDCRRALDVRVGEWVARYPDRAVRGYHIPKLLIPGKRSVGLVVANSRKTKDFQRTAWFTRDLGIAYAPAEGRLSLEQVEANVRPELRLLDPWGMVPATSRLRTMGVDVASVRGLNVVIEEEVEHERETVGRKLWVGEVEDDPARGTAFAQLCRLMQVFGVQMAAIDAHPEGRFAEAFAARFPGRVYRVSFFEPKPTQKRAPEAWNVDDQEMFVSLWRTRAYDATFARFRMQHALIPPLDQLPADYATQLGNLYRQKIEDPASGAVQVRYVRTGPEDYGQAEAYNLTAIELHYRRVGLGLVMGQGPVPLGELDPDAVVEDEEAAVFGGEPIYRAGFGFE